MATGAQMTGPGMRNAHAPSSSAQYRHDYDLRQATHMPPSNHVDISPSTTKEFIIDDTIDRSRGLRFEGDDYEDDEDYEDEVADKKRTQQRRGAATPDDDYDDIYGQYAEMPSIRDSSMSYNVTIDDRAARAQRQKSLDRKGSTSEKQTLSRWGSLWSVGSRKRSGSNSDRAISASGTLKRGTSQQQHKRGMPSVERTLPLSSPAARNFGWFPATWPARLFIFITLCEAAADISIEAVLLSRFRQQQGSISINGGNLSALPVFLLVFGMAHVYQVFLAIDSVVNRNTILVLGLVSFNLAFLVYALIQITEIRDVLGDGVIPGTSQTVPVQVLTGAIPVIIGCSEIIYIILAWFLWKEFGWQIYKTIGADRRLKKAHMHFQIFVCFLKFDFFTFIAFCLQLVLVVLSKSTPEFWVTTFAAPVTLVILIFAWYSVRMELKWGTVSFMLALWGGAGYFIYKLIRIWQRHLGVYKDVYKSLTVFSVLALALLFATFLVTIRCMMNFDIGLKNAMTRSAQERKALKEEEMGPVISSPFRYDADSPYFQQGGNGSLAPALYGKNGATGAKLGQHNASSTQMGYGGHETAPGYFSPYTPNSSANTPHSGAYNGSSAGLLSPTKSPSGLTPLKSSSALNLERQNSKMNHRLSLD